MRYKWHVAGRGPVSNLESTIVFTIRKGKILAIEFVWDPGEVLEAAGLRE